MREVKPFGASSEEDAMAELVGGMVGLLVLAGPVLWLIMVGVSASVTSEKRRSGGEGLLLALFLGPVGMLFAALLPWGGRACRACREKINPKATICPFCRTEGPVAPPRKPSAQPGAKARSDGAPRSERDPDRPGGVYEIS